MARPLVFRFGGAEIPLEMRKVDRADLYGYVDVEALDDQGRRCAMATLADDGRTVAAPGGTTFATLSPEGKWLEKAKLKPVDSDGREIQPVPSSFSAPVPLERKASVDEYLSHNIKGVYQLQVPPEASALLAELKAGTIYAFPYSYRGGLEADAGFLLMGADGTVFLAVGVPTQLEFVGLEQAGGVVEEEAAEEEESADIDFGMM